MLWPCRPREDTTPEVGGERALGPAVAVLAVGRGRVGDARALLPRPRRRQERRRRRPAEGRRGPRRGRVRPS